MHGARRAEAVRRAAGVERAVEARLRATLEAQEAIAAAISDQRLWVRIWGRTVALSAERV